MCVPRSSFVFALLCLSGQVLADATPSPEGAAVYFIEPVDGAIVSNPVHLRFGLRGMGIAPAGIDFENTGHHHLFIDGDPPAAGVPIPAGAQHVHFGKGQTEADITLPAGKHVLRLVLGDHLHVPHHPPVVSAPISVEVR